MHRINPSVQFVRSASRTAPASTEGDWIPNTDVYTTDEGLVIKVELAGMRREDLSLAVEDNRLRISGNRPDGCRSPKCNFLVMEINYGRFENIIEIPGGYDLNRAIAAYVNGFLRIDIPRQRTERNGHSSTGRSS